ncbi:MAG TPA: 2-oxoglutarate dehydrogenase E1 component [Gemmataceae bacterium]|jgi:2-oxoglutarate dehydrogenase E1 component
MNPTFATRWNQGAIDDAYQRWRADPRSVDETWRAFFEGFALAERTPAPAAGASEQLGIFRLVNAYRNLGHLLAHVDPLTDPPPTHPYLELSQFGLSDTDLDRTFDAIPFLGLPRGTLRELIAALRETYCRTIGVEYLHIQDMDIRNWLQERMEPRRNRPKLPLRQKMRVLMVLHYAELFEKFLHNRYQGQKRFSLEGAETTIPVLDAMIEKAAELGAREVVIGMAHRGRLNVLTNILRKPYQDVFGEFEDVFLETTDGDGDVKYHLGFSSDFETARGHKIHLSLSPNPSHLEAVNPVVEGRVRAKQRRAGDTERRLGIPLLIHGDAAMAGQGSVAETLNLSNLTGYRTGGTLHVVINNQIGFTTNPADARSTRYCTDVAKMIQAPIFHVNAEDPEAAVWLAELCVEFRQTFHRDVVLDVNCYRKHGHNEGDNPAFTQPVMYAKIKNRPSQLQIYEEHLVVHGDLTADEALAIDEKFQEKLKKAQDEVKKSPPKKRGMHGFSGVWRGLRPRFDFTPAATAVPFDVLREVTDGVTQMPEGFVLNPTIARIFEHRQTILTERKPIDWPFAETLAFGTLVLAGTPVRLSGQDSRRGTFSQRHAVVYDARNNEAYTPLCRIRPGRQASFKVYDSMLSEFAVLGFEFGYSLDDPTSLVLWEAQFGDFANGAQVIIDQFLVCSESKWQRASGLVLLLPHGYEGQGPEHSSARLERFLQLSAENNIQVCNLTTPAQYFHALRRQVKREFRKPLIVMTPKSLLRHKEAVSPVNEFTDGQFREIIDDPAAEPDRVRRVLACSGKVYYDLQQARRDGGVRDVAIVRVEQLYPLHEELLKQTLGRYRRAKELVWVQEEPLNMGAWSYMDQRLRGLGYQPLYVGRDASASPATGSHHVHEHEQRELVEVALAGLAPHQVRAVPALVKSRGEPLETDVKRPAMSPTG